MDDVREVVGFSNYTIRLDGTVTNIKTGKPIKPEIFHGYKRMKMWKNGERKHKMLHRVIAEAFIPNPEGYRCINHIDGNKQNNSLDNLEWCTHKHNIQHAYDTGLHKKGPRGHHNNAPGRQVRIVETGEEFKSMVLCAESIGGNPNKIQDCLMGRQHTHRGYHFEEI